MNSALLLLKLKKVKVHSYKQRQQQQHRRANPNRQLSLRLLLLLLLFKFLCLTKINLGFALDGVETLSTNEEVVVVEHTSAFTPNQIIHTSTWQQQQPRGRA